MQAVRDNEQPISLSLGFVAVASWFLLEFFFFFSALFGYVHGAKPLHAM